MGSTIISCPNSFYRRAKNVPPMNKDGGSLKKRRAKPSDFDKAPSTRKKSISFGSAVSRAVSVRSTYQLEGRDLQDRTF
jgi:hypothetical protein